MLWRLLAQESRVGQRDKLVPVHWLSVQPLAAVLCLWLIRSITAGQRVSANVRHVIVVICLSDLSYFSN